MDISYNLNEAWVHKADTANAIDPGTGKKWLIAILVTCGVLYIGSLVVLGFLFKLYSGCTSNTVFLSITIVFSIVITLAQLMGEEGSLLTSAVITAYGTYLAFLTVSKNPNQECNPFLRDRDILGIILGIGITLLSLTWAGWSHTADKHLLSER